MQRVFVVDRDAFFGGRWPDGFLPISGADASAFLQRAFAGGRFEDRPIAEATPAWKQWIPYCVLRCRGPSDERGVFTVRRTTGQSEARLHGRWSIGIGGHVDEEDAAEAPADGASFFARALARELAEELHFEGPAAAGPVPRFLGILNDDRTPVGQVHAGLVYAWDLEACLAEARRAVGVREIAKMEGCFGSLAEFGRLWQDPARFESWSQFLIQAGVAGPMGHSNEVADVRRLQVRDPDPNPS
jgi:predicted NUDIX family phosphoesterase